MYPFLTGHAQAQLQFDNKWLWLGLVLSAERRTAMASNRCSPVRFRRFAGERLFADSLTFGQFSHNNPFAQITGDHAR